MTVGETHTPQTTFKDSANSNYAPTTVTAKVRAPNGTISTPSVTNPSLGIYQMTFTLTQVGVWRFQFTGDGPTTSVVKPWSYVCAQSDPVAA